MELHYNFTNHGFMPFGDCHFNGGISKKKKLKKKQQRKSRRINRKKK